MEQGTGTTVFKNAYMLGSGNARNRNNKPFP